MDHEELSPRTMPTSREEAAQDMPDPTFDYPLPTDDEQATCS